MIFYKKLMIGMVCTTAVGALACYGETFWEKLDACFKEHQAEIQKRIKEWNDYNLNDPRYCITDLELRGVVCTAYDRTARWMKLMFEWHLDFFDYFKVRLSRYNKDREKRIETQLKSYDDVGDSYLSNDFFIDSEKKNTKLYCFYLKQFFVEKDCALALQMLREMVADFTQRGIPCECLKKYEDACKELHQDIETLRNTPSLKAYLEKSVCTSSDLIQSITNNRRYFLYTENDRYAVERIDQFFEVISLPEIMWKDEEPKTCHVSKLEDAPKCCSIIAKYEKKEGWECTPGTMWQVQHSEQCHLYRDVFRNCYIKYAKYNPAVVEKLKDQTTGFCTFPRPPLDISDNIFDKKGRCDALLDEALCNWLNVKDDLSNLLYCACCGYKYLKDRLWLLEAQGREAPWDNNLARYEGGLQDYIEYDSSTNRFPDYFKDKFIERVKEMYDLLKDLKEQLEKNKK